MALSTIMGTSYACLGAVRNLENVGKKTCADLLLNFRERRKAEVQLRRNPLLGTSVNKPPADVPGSARWHHAWCRPSRASFWCEMPICMGKAPVRFFKQRL